MGLSAALSASATHIRTANMNSATHFGPGCTLRVLIKKGTDAASRQAVGARLVATHAFSTILFVPKAVTLEVMKREEPALVRQLGHYNPFHDAFDATAVSPAKGAEVLLIIRKWPSVVKVIPFQCPELRA
jgi:hypothetical protein